MEHLLFRLRTKLLKLIHSVLGHELIFASRAKSDNVGGYSFVDDIMAVQGRKNQHSIQ